MDKSTKVINIVQPEIQEKIQAELNGLTFTKNFRSATAEEWYVFLSNYQDPKEGGAAGKVFIHYDLYGNKEVYINTTVIFNDPKLHDPLVQPLVYGIAEELVNRLVGFADTLLAVHAGENSYHAEYISKN